MTTALPYHAVAGSLVATPPRWRLSLQRTFPQDANAIWEAVTDPDQVAAWTPFRPDRNLATEGPVRLAPVDGSDESHDSMVLETTPHESLTYFWGTDQLRFTLINNDEGTTLTIIHTFDDHNFAPSMAAGWHLCLGALELLLQGNEVPSVVGENAKAFGWEDLEAAYSALFESQTDRSIPDDQTEEE
jgi:uncharacterized protein YndB with AHSA1/START domain